MNYGGKVLITGGTSGLGLELVRVFLQRGFFVITTGRREIEVSGSDGRLGFYPVDFSDLRQTAVIFRRICDDHILDYVIYNAGILSPAEFMRTGDGFEYTYQINFLAHLLANELIIQSCDHRKPMRIAAVTSMAYRVAMPQFRSAGSSEEYRAWRAYSDSKLYLALMCRHYSVKYARSRIQFISFDPGIFGSQLYRTQSGVFRIVYQTGVRILRKPGKQATVLSDILTGAEIINGAVYDVRKRIRKLPEPESSVNDTFWDRSIREIEKFLV